MFEVIEKGSYLEITGSLSEKTSFRKKLTRKGYSANLCNLKQANRDGLQWLKSFCQEFSVEILYLSPELSKEMAQNIDLFEDAPMVRSVLTSDSESSRESLVNNDVIFLPDFSNQFKQDPESVRGIVKGKSVEKQLKVLKELSRVSVTEELEIEKADKRKFFRKKTSLSVKFREIRQKKFVSVTALNLSAGGLFLNITDQKPKIGSIVELDFAIPFHGIKVYAEVVSNVEKTFFKKAGVGLRFLSLEPSQVRALKDYCEQ